jgi:hypothetical protein
MHEKTEMITSAGHVQQSRAIDRVFQVDADDNQSLLVFHDPTPTSSGWQRYLPKALGQVGLDLSFYFFFVCVPTPTSSGWRRYLPKALGQVGLDFSIFFFRLCPDADQQRLAALPPQSIGAGGVQFFVYFFIVCVPTPTSSSWRR